MDYHSVLFKPFHLAIINVQGTTVLIILLFCLLIFSFIMSGAEVAFFSLTYKDINSLKVKQQEGYKRIVELLEHPKILLGTLLIANSFVNIAIIIISNLLIDNFFPTGQTLEWIEFLIKVVSVTFLLVMFGEVMPKVLATQNNIRFAKDVGPVVELIYYLFKNMSSWLVKYSDIIEKKLSRRTNGSITNEELYHAIDITDTGTNEKEKTILKGILKFGNTSVKQIMKTRLDVHGIDYDIAFNHLIEKVGELHYSRLPVYKEDLDEVVGMIHTKDLVPYLQQNESFDWHKIMRQPYFVHEQKMIEDLLKEFQSKRIHFAVVVDEFGGTSGIVTMEDILEEVIGEITDEFDEDDAEYKKLDDYNYLFEGRTMINDVCKFMQLPTDTFDRVKGESDSLAGLVLEIAGEIPKVLSVITCGDFDFTIIEMERNRINKIKITIKPQLEQ